MLEKDFQQSIIAELNERLPGCFIMKNDESYIQGVPDLTILYEGRWAMLECKKSSQASHQPNQDYYIELLDRMSFAAFIFPENRKEILDGVCKALQSGRSSRILRGE